MSYIRIFVGLGGFGSSVVHQLYKIVKDENSGNVPAYLRFATYDSAMDEKPKKEDFPNAVDFMKVSPDTPQKFLNDCKMKYESFEKWWPGLWLDKSEKSLWSTSDLIWSGKGLGQYRPFGRLGFFKHLTEQPENILSLINNELTTAARSINVEVNAVTPRIIIFNSLAGGTGSSSFIDVASLIKQNIGRVNASLEIILFTVTGEVSMKGRAAENSDAYQWALANSYAALSELDYWEAFDSSSLEIDYPRYGSVACSSPVFKHASIICQDTSINTNLSKYSDYAKYLANVINVIEARVISTTTFTTVFDNILTHMKRFGSIGVGSIHYRYKDGLLYEFSQLAEEAIMTKILRPFSVEVRNDIENEIESLYLEEEGYYKGDINSLDSFRKDSVFKLLEDPYEDTRKITMYFPFITTSKLDSKISHENIQSVLRSIKELDAAIINFLDVKKKDVYDLIRSQIKSHLFFNQIKEQSISYIKEYLTQIKMIIDSRIKGLEKDIPEVFENIHHKRIEREFKERTEYLEKKQNKKSLEEFRECFKKYYEIKKLVFKSKAKLELYKNLSRQLEWYLNAVDEILKPVQESVLKHYRMVKEGLQIGTHSEYEKDTFTIYALPIEKNVEKYKSIYGDFCINKKHEKEQIANQLNDKAVKAISNGSNGSGSLLEIYKVQPVWKDETIIQISNPNELNFDKREDLKNYIKSMFYDVMVGDFENYIKDFLPQNSVEAIYVESLGARRKFKDLLGEKKDNLNKLVEPFVILGQALDNNELTERTPITSLVISKNDLEALFIKYGNDTELLTSKDEIIGTVLSNSSMVETPSLEKLTMIKMISGFGLQSVATYNNLFKPAYEKLTKYESFADIRLKPGKSTKEIVFLLAEYYGIIEAKEPQFKYDGKTLETGLKGRENVINWFLEERNTDKINQIKRKLKIVWNEVSNSERKGVFEKVLSKLEAKKKNIKDDNLYKIVENNILTIQHAIDFKYYENIYKEFE